MTMTEPILVGLVHRSIWSQTPGRIDLLALLLENRVTGRQHARLGAGTAVWVTRCGEPITCLEAKFYFPFVDPELYDEPDVPAATI